MDTAATRHPDLAARLVVDPALRRGWLALADRAAADAALHDRSLLRAERLGRADRARAQAARALVLAPTQTHALDMAYGLAAERGDREALAGLAARMTAAPEKTIAAAFLAPGEAVLDIGAFPGTTAHLFAGAGAGRIDCCEPNPDNVAVLRRSLPAVARLHPIALSASAGTVELAVPEGRAGAGSIDAAFAATANADRLEAVRRHRVEAARLDDLGLPAHRLWKIDVEGAELTVLDGAAATLDERPPAPAALTGA